MDPYGDPWPVLDAFLAGYKPTASKLVLAVNDGLRQRLRRGACNDVGSMATVAPRFGSRIRARYLQVCEFLMNEKAAAAGYRLSNFVGYYTGAMEDITHYAAVWSRVQA